VIGYPMGIAGMVAKSPSGIYERMAYRHNDINAASELAALSLIRPSTTCGHLGDVVGDKLIYDAPTAHGGSGGPVFNTKGEVIGVNSAYHGRLLWWHPRRQRRRPPPPAAGSAKTPLAIIALQITALLRLPLKERGFQPRRNRTK
jgi:hypothetical protein